MKKRVARVATKGLELAREKSFQRYLFVGFSTVFIDIAILALLREKFSGGIFSAVSIAYWASVAYNFLMNRHWSFQANKGMAHKQIFHYSVLLVINYIVTIGIITGLESLGINEYIGKVVALCITISWTYFIYKQIIFKVEE